MTKMMRMSSTDRLVRGVLRDFTPYSPGTTIDEARKRFALDRVIKLSSNENPLGSSPLAEAAVRNIDQLNIYLDDSLTELREKIGRRIGVAAGQIVIGHGSNELVNYICTAFLESGDEALMATPSFSLYAKSARMHGGVLVEVPLKDGVHDLPAMAAAVSSKTKIVFVCDPNNPTGTWIEHQAWRAFIAALSPDVLLVVDQAYFEYMDGRGWDTIPLATERPNTIVLRTMSKIYGLASMRCGYGVASPEVIGWIHRVRVPFNVTRPTALAAGAALDDSDFVARSLENNRAGIAYLYPEFARLGLFAYPTAANFVALKVPVEADEAYLGLMKRGIVVRSGDGLCLPHFLRVTIGTPEQNREFIGALEALLATWKTRA